MKTKLLIIFSLFTLYSVSFSQVFSSYGFKTGLAGAYQSWNELGYKYLTDTRFGFIAGFFGEFFQPHSITNKQAYFSAVLETNYEQKGGNTKIINSSTTNNYSTINLLSVPIEAKFTFPRGKLAPYMFIGPRVDILISKNDGIYEGEYDELNPVNFGASVGLGTEIEISKKMSLLFEGKYSPDFTTYQFNKTSGVYHTYEIRNISFEITTGLKFNH